jgi:hypothetical protein
MGTGQERYSKQPSEAVGATAGVVASDGMSVPPPSGCDTEKVAVVPEDPPEPHSTPAITNGENKGISTVPLNQNLAEAVSAHPTASAISEEPQTADRVVLGHIPPSPPEVARTDAEDATLADSTKGPGEVLDLTGARRHAAEDAPKQSDPESGPNDIPTADDSAQTAGATGAGPTIDEAKSTAAPESGASEVPANESVAQTANGQIATAGATGAGPTTDKTESMAATNERAGHSDRQANTGQGAAEQTRRFPEMAEGGGEVTGNTKATPEPVQGAAPSHGNGGGIVRKRKSSLFARIKSAFTSPKKDKPSA